MTTTKRHRNGPKVGAYFSGASRLTAKDVTALRKIKDSDDFIKAIDEIASEYDGEVGFLIGERGKVTPGQFREALRAIIRAGKRSPKQWAASDWLTRDRIEAQAFVMWKPSERFDLWAAAHPAELVQTARLLLALDDGKNRDTANIAEIRAARQLQSAFKRFGIKFTTYDGGSSDGAQRSGGPAARCIRIIAKMKANADVEHILAKAIKLP